MVTAFLVGPLVDRYRGSRLLPLYLLPHGVGLILLATYDPWGIAFLYMAGAGVTAGAGSPIVGAMWAEIYGVAHMGAIRSLVQGLMVVSTACAPGPMGALIVRGTTMGEIALMALGVVVVSTLLATVAMFRFPVARVVAGHANRQE